MDKDYQKRWYAANKEKAIAYVKKNQEKRKQDDPLYYVKKIFNERKRWSSAKGILFNINLEDVPEVPTVCPILGIPLISGGHNNPNSPSLDRIYPEKGYTKGNLCWMSFRANRLKADGSLEEMEQVLKWLRKRGEIYPT